MLENYQSSTTALGRWNACTQLVQSKNILQTLISIRSLLNIVHRTRSALKGSFYFKGHIIYTAKKHETWTFYLRNFFFVGCVWHAQLGQAKTWKILIFWIVSVTRSEIWEFHLGNFQKNWRNIIWRNMKSPFLLLHLLFFF